MEVEVLENYAVELGKVGSFSFNGFRLNHVLFANIRSIKGKIGENEFDKDVLKDLVRDFLRVYTNVELVNILSRELNHFDYFEIYDKSFNQNTELKMDDILGKDEVAATAATSYLEQIKAKNY